jgi:hypothetical protein
MLYDDLSGHAYFSQTYDMKDLYHRYVYWKLWIHANFKLLYNKKIQSVYFSIGKLIVLHLSSKTKTNNHSKSL